MGIGKILVPIDLSENSETGVACAISLARENSAEMIFLYVTSFPFYLLSLSCEGDLLLDRDDLEKFNVQQMLKEARYRVSGFLKKHFDDSLAGLRHSTEVSVGKVAEEIVFEAVRKEADLIVMAKRYRRFPGRIFSRSVSEAVSLQAPCPIFSVCPPKLVRPVWEGWRVPLSAGSW